MKQQRIALLLSFSFVRSFSKIHSETETYYCDIFIGKYYNPSILFTQPSWRRCCVVVFVKFSLVLILVLCDGFCLWFQKNREQQQKNCARMYILKARHCVAENLPPAYYTHILFAIRVLSK